MHEEFSRGTPLRAIAGHKRATAARLETKIATLRAEADDLDAEADRRAAALAAALEKAAS